jgi:sirohydrochlorin ferrochelatase
MNSNLEQLDIPLEKTAVVLVDHGSRRDESNKLLLDVVAAFRQHAGWSIVEPAHMELAEPSIATAFARCVQQGAELVIVFPYFLAPGRHWNDDIPRLAAEAAQAWPGIKHFVTAPLGLHALILQVIDERIATCLERVAGGDTSCEICSDSIGCTLLPSKSSSV